MKCFLTVFMLNLFFASMSQSFERKVIAAAGRETKNTLSGYTMTYTLGESIIQGKSTINVGVLSNGFIQPTTSPTSSAAYLQPNDIVIYPNPFDTRLVIDSHEEGEVKVQLVNQEGKIIVQEIIVANNHELEIPENCAPGIYFLTIYSVSGEFIQ